MVRDFYPDSGKDGRERALVQGEQRLNNVLGAFPNEMARSSQKQGVLKALHPTLPYSPCTASLPRWEIRVKGGSCARG